ncbi:MFS transporter [Priestia megaterium]|uniref:MFS transporter n=1 Tax=Priestia megaterium TaxID=1404 RepID=UPI002E22F104|nr:MFS transporter [Priestia megaterium]MED4298064.1 MFS transporter [Priestia megaterium]
MSKIRTMEEMPLSKFHYKMFAYASGSTFLDGYIIGIVAIALSVMHTQLNMSVTMMGLIGAATLAGMLFGGVIGGYLTDIIGRKKMFIIDMLVMAIVSILQFYVNDPVQLVALRFILGIAVGADYPIAGALMTEFAPTKNRGALLGGLNGLWYVGYAVSFLVGFLLLSLGDNSWRWMLASSAVPVILMLVSRLNMPESPRWLASKGREEEANAIVQKIFGDNVIMSSDKETETQEKTSFLDMFRNGYGKLIFFVTAFYSLQVLPLYGINTYIPEILGQFGFADGTREYLGSAVINLIYLIGLFPALYLVDKFGRRPTLYWSFLICSISLFVLGATSEMNMPFIFILALFVIYGSVNTGMGAHCWIYPNELFPTHIRGTAGGFTTGVARIASSVGTFLSPAIMASYGLATTLYICGAVLFIGFLVSLFMAPETKDMSLSQASSINKSKSKNIEQESFVSNKTAN